MLTFTGSKHRLCDGLSRRDFLKVGALGSLGLADLLRLQARAGTAPPASPRSVIMIYLPGGPSHIDMYDLRPDAPVEFRGPFKPIATKVSGVRICELMPEQARIADRIAIVNGLQTFDFHSAEALMTGVGRNSDNGATPQHPVFGSIVSRIRGTSVGGMPTYVALGGDNISDSGNPAYLGQGYRPFTGGGAGLENLGLVRGVTPNRLQDRKRLLHSFDQLRRDIDARGELTGMDAFTARALDAVTSGKARAAFDLSREPLAIREKFGRASSLLLARRLVEAGVAVVTVSCGGGMLPHVNGTWDTHGSPTQINEHFLDLKVKLPGYDHAVATLINDLFDRGLDRDVLVVIWGEFGRTPRINKYAGRDHWAPASFAVLAGGGLQMGQTIGNTGPRAERECRRSTPYTPQNVLATIYHVLGIDSEATIPDFSGRPRLLLDDPRRIEELL